MKIGGIGWIEMNEGWRDWMDGERGKLEGLNGWRREKDGDDGTLDEE